MRFSAALLSLVSLAAALPGQSKAATPLRKIFRKSDSEWNHVVRGAEVKRSTSYSGELESYDLRVKNVDPSKLGVDKVKQMSGYLDDNDNDKHLFYCK